MSSPKVLRWVVAVPCAFAVGAAIAFGSWHFQDSEFLKHFQRGSGVDHAKAASGSEGGGHSGGSPVQTTASSTSTLPSLTQGAFVAQERPPTHEKIAAMLEQEKQKAANEALTSYILSQEELPKLNQTSSEPPPVHPLVEELINKPNAMRGSVMGGEFIHRVLGGSDVGNLGGYSQDVLREALQAFNSPANAALRADASAVAEMTLGQVSALKELQDEVQSRLEQGRGGSLENILNLDGGLNIPGGTRRAVGEIVANALGGFGTGASYSEGSGSGFPIMGNAMAPPVGSPTVPVVEVDPSQFAAAAALVTEYRRLLPDLSEAEMKEYLRRVETDGKISAMQWVVRMKSAGS